MLLQGVVLQNFRSYDSCVFYFGEGITVVVGENAAGKTNFLEAIYLLSTGKSFRAEKDWQLLQFAKDIGRVKGKLLNPLEENSTISLEVALSVGTSSFLQKRYFVNGIPRRRIDFVGKFPVVLFVPADMDLVGGSPSLRRAFLDEVLEQVDFEYRLALQTYTKALRQRNALLERVQATGIRNDKVFVYWDGILIECGQSITQKRKMLIDYINRRDKEFFQFYLHYDSSVISEERLDKYKQAELAVGVTLVGPHRDDINVQVPSPQVNMQEHKEAKYFASRGQQRLIVLEMKLSQVAFHYSYCGQKPMLLLDDIFSELDSKHIGKVLDMVKRQQTIITTTHREFVKDLVIPQMEIVELEKKEGRTTKKT